MFLKTFLLLWAYAERYEPKERLDQAKKTK